jgi:hemerythrin-like domain-containing protein
MGPTEILSAEHRVIEQVLDCLEKMAAGVRGGSGLDRERAAQALEVLRTYADRIHHGKEEERLFPSLHARGLPRHVGPIAVMLHDHEVGRGLIRRMADGLLDVGPEGGGAQQFADAAAAYVEMLRDHIAKEDGVLFPLAESVLDPAGAEALRAELERFDRDELEPGLLERVRGTAEALARHFDVPLAAQRSKPVATGPGPCH